jgi:predicted DNA-binding protein (MmcQ/YjbR family)
MTRAEIKKYIKKKYKVDIGVMNVKLDPELITFIKNTKGFAEAFHMNKTHWVSIEIGKVSDTKIKSLIEMSFNNVL